MREIAYAGSGVSDLVLQNKGEEQMTLFRPRDRVRKISLHIICVKRHISQIEIDQEALRNED